MRQIHCFTSQWSALPTKLIQNLLVVLRFRPAFDTQSVGWSPRELIMQLFHLLLQLHEKNHFSEGPLGIGWIDESINYFLRGNFMIIIF